LSFIELRKIEKAEMNYDEFVDKIAYALNCLTECPSHKISYCAAAVGISPGDLVKFE